jgi:peptidoglycan-associated lipoprotein
MERSRWISVFAIILLTGILAGCGSNARDDQADGVETGAVADDGAFTGDALGADGRPASSRIYFDFDSARVDDNSRETLESHASYLSANPGVKVKLEGHCDERGTREYNLALGERRAKAAAKLMELLGVSKSRIDTTSYGEEKPLEEGHTEAAWSKNRRVEIIYSGS